MQMSNSEIAGSYRRSDNKPKQIKILAELNACPVEKIREILQSEGLLKERAKSSGRKNQDEAARDIREEKPKFPTATEGPKDHPMLPCVPSWPGMPDQEQDHIAEITGGEGDVEGYDPLENRAAEIGGSTRKLPDVVREVLEREADSLIKQIADMKRRRDAIVDFLRGEA